MAELEVPKSMPSVPAGEEVMEMEQKPTVAEQFLPSRAGLEDRAFCHQASR
jgi:hypothetical protein